MNRQPPASELSVSHHAAVAPSFSGLMLATGLGWNELAQCCGYRIWRADGFAQRKNIELRPAD